MGPLFREWLSLIRLRKFPVLLHRELRKKAPKIGNYLDQPTRTCGPDLQISLISGNLALRLVSDGLGRQPASVAFSGISGLPEFLRKSAGCEVGTGLREESWAVFRCSDVNFDGQSPTANFQYPNLICRDTARITGRGVVIDRGFDVSVIACSPCRLSANDPLGPKESEAMTAAYDAVQRVGASAVAFAIPKDTIIGPPDVTRTV